MTRASAVLLVAVALLGVAAAMEPVVAPEDVVNWPFARYVREFRKSYTASDYEVREKLYEVRYAG